MPRKKQLIQRQRRQKAYRAGASAAALDLRPKGAFRVFHNYKLFAIIGAVVMVGGIGFNAFFYNNGGHSGGSGSPRGQGVIRTTPEAASTSVASAPATVKEYAAPPPLTIDPTKTYTAVIKTARGDVRVELLPKDAPRAVNNFVFLAQRGFYNGNTFYRVIADARGKVHFVQAGDPSGAGTGGPGYTLPVESRSNAFDATAGVLAMAKPQAADEPNNGSQFFITTTVEPTFDGKYTAFGKVISGLDLLSKLSPRDPQTQQDPPPGERIDAIEIQIR